MHKIDAPGATADNRFTEGDSAASIPATEVSAAWLNAVQAELVKVIDSAGLTLKDSEGETGDQLLSAMQAMGVGTGQFQKYSSLRIYETGETCRGSDGHFYEFYDRDGIGAVQGVDPTDPLNRPHIWMRWYGDRPGSVIEWRSETLPEGYIENDGSEISRTDYRRVFDAFGTTHGAGDGSTTFLLPDDRGEFKRGFDNGRGVDPGRSIANWQPATGISEYVAHGANLRSTLGIRNADGVVHTSEIFNTTEYINRDVVAANYKAVRPRNNAVIWLTKI